MGALVDLLRLAPRAELVSMTCYLGVIVAVVGEWTWLRFRKGDRNVRHHLTAATMGVGGVVIGGLVTSVWVALWGPLSVLSPRWLGGMWEVHPVLGAVVAFIAWDAASWVYHYVGHQTAIGWASHQVHHSGTRYNMSLAWRQSWLPIPAVVVFPALALGGFRLSVLGVCAAVSSLYQALCHFSGTVPVPRPIAWVFVTPDSHRRHHVIDAKPANFGAVLTIWDRLAGTWNPFPTTSVNFGIPGRTGDEGPVSVEIAGWRNLLRCAERPGQPTLVLECGATPPGHQSSGPVQAQKRRTPRP